MEPHPPVPSRIKLAFGVIALTAAGLVFPLHHALRGPAGGVDVLWSRIGPIFLLALGVAIISLTLCCRHVPRALKRRGYSRFAAEGNGVALEVVTVLAGVAAMVAAAEGRWLDVGLRLSIPAVVLVTGIIVFRRAHHRGRIEPARGFRCPECDYSFGFQREQDAPERCSECGTQWRGRLVPVVARPPALFLPTAGLSLLVLLFAGLVLPSIPVQHLMPTQTVLWWAGTRPGGESVWATLDTRPVSEAQTEALAERLLDRRKRQHWALSAGAHRWLEARIAANELPIELRERFFAEMVVLQLEVPSRIRVGESFVAGVTAKRNEGGFTFRPIVYGRGVAVGGQWFDSFSPAQGQTPYVFSPPGALPCMHTKIALQAPGTFDIRVEVWVVTGAPFGPGGSPANITWNSDGTPVLPAGAAWSERVVLEGEIEVIPASPSPQR